jgi:tripartite-type tricarboxylate transporter receptor subunit TctC
MKPWILSAALLVSLCFSSLSLADTFPNKPVRILVGFPPGGMADIVARALSDRLAIQWKQSVIVDNRPGAAGVIAADLLTKSPADGHTLLVILTNHVIVAAIKPKLPFDVLKDFAAVTLVGDSPLLLMANPKVLANNLAELTSLAKAKPGTITFSTPGEGTVHHLSTELLSSNLGIKMIHVPYIGGAPAMMDAMSGVVDLNLGSPSQALQQIEAGKLKPLAYTGTKRSTLLPNVPTVAESGIPGFQASLWAGVLAPAKTPKALVDKIQSDIKQAMNTPEVREKMNKLGIDMINSSPEDFDQFMKSELTKWTSVAKQAQIKSD